MKGEQAPLKFKLEYYDMITSEILNHQQLVTLKGSIDIFVSKSTNNPQ